MNTAKVVPSEMQAVGSPQIVPISPPIGANCKRSLFLRQRNFQTLPGLCRTRFRYTIPDNGTRKAEHPAKGSCVWAGSPDGAFWVPDRRCGIPDSKDLAVHQCRLRGVRNHVDRNRASDGGGRLVGVRITGPEADSAPGRWCGGIIVWRFADCGRHHVCCSVFGTELNAEPYSFRWRHDPGRIGSNGLHTWQ